MPPEHAPSATATAQGGEAAHLVRVTVRVTVRVRVTVTVTDTVTDTVRVRVRVSVRVTAHLAFCRRHGARCALTRTRTLTLRSRLA